MKTRRLTKQDIASIKQSKENARQGSLGCGIVSFIIGVILMFFGSLLSDSPFEDELSMASIGAILAIVGAGFLLMGLFNQGDATEVVGDVWVTDSKVITKKEARGEDEQGGTVTFEDATVPPMKFKEDKWFNMLMIGDHVHMEYHQPTDSILKLNVKRTLSNGDQYRVMAPSTELWQLAKDAEGTDPANWPLGQLMTIKLPRSTWFGKQEVKRLGLRARVREVFLEKGDKSGDEYADEYALILDSKEFEYVPALYAPVKEIRTNDVVYAEFETNWNSLKLLRLRVLERPGVADTTQLPTEWASNDA